MIEKLEKNKKNTFDLIYRIIALVVLVVGVIFIGLNYLLNGGSLNDVGVVQESWFLPVGMFLTILGIEMAIVSLLVKIIIRIVKKLM